MVAHGCLMHLLQLNCHSSWNISDQSLLYFTQQGVLLTASVNANEQAAEVQHPRMPGPHPCAHSVLAIASCCGTDSVCSVRSGTART